MVRLLLAFVFSENFMRCGNDICFICLENFTLSSLYYVFFPFSSIFLFQKSGKWNMGWRSEKRFSKKILFKLEPTTNMAKKVNIRILTRMWLLCCSIVQVLKVTKHFLRKHILLKLIDELFYCSKVERNEIFFWKHILFKWK